MKKLICLALLSLTSISYSQTKLDLEFLAGVTFNAKQGDYTDGNYSFGLKTGYSYGLGFDLWMKNDIGISGGYTYGQSTGMSTYSWPDRGTESRRVGSMEDRFFYLGVKKKFQFAKSTALIPFLGMFWNSVYFDSDDIQFNTLWEFNGQERYENVYSYVRYNRFNEGFYGTIGMRTGLGLEQKLGAFGALTLNVSYNWDISRNLDFVAYGSYEETTTDINSGSVLTSSNSTNFENKRIGRNTFQIEIGYKMPCSIVFIRKKNKGKESTN